MSVTMTGVDTAKSVFQIHAVDETGKALIRRKLSRTELIPFFEKQETCSIIMEACGAARHWARLLASLGHQGKLIAPEAVRPFVKKGKKNDAAGAAALCEAAPRPEMKFVPVKTVEQQTMLVNAMRGLAAEFGLTVPKGINRLDELTALVDADQAFPEVARGVFRELHGQRDALSASIETTETKIGAHARGDETARRLATIPGIGPITASLIAATVADIGMVKNARHFAAWLGLVPRQYSTGGKTRLGRITKAGNREIRKLLVLGATSMVYRAEQWISAVGAWTRGVLERRPVRLVTVALANKLARIAWAELVTVPMDRLRSIGMPTEGSMTRKEVYRAKGQIVAAAEVAA